MQINLLVDNKRPAKCKEAQQQPKEIYARGVLAPYRPTRLIFDKLIIHMPLFRDYREKTVCHPH